MLQSGGVKAHGFTHAFISCQMYVAVLGWVDIYLSALLKGIDCMEERALLLGDAGQAEAQLVYHICMRQLRAW